MKDPQFRESHVDDEIAARTQNAKKLAVLFGHLKGLSFKQFYLKLPMSLDFITANELFEKINSQ